MNELTPLHVGSDILECTTTEHTEVTAVKAEDLDSTKDGTPEEDN